METYEEFTRQFEPSYPNRSLERLSDVEDSLAAFGPLDEEQVTRVGSDVDLRKPQGAEIVPWQLYLDDEGVCYVKYGVFRWAGVVTSVFGMIEGDDFEITTTADKVHSVSVRVDFRDVLGTDERALMYITAASPNNKLAPNGTDTIDYADIGWVVTNESNEVVSFGNLQKDVVLNYTRSDT